MPAVTKPTSAISLACSRNKTLEPRRNKTLEPRASPQEYRCLRGLPPRTTSMVAVERPALLARFTASGWLSDHARTCPENPASAAAPAARVE